MQRLFASPTRRFFPVAPVANPVAYVFEDLAMTDLAVGLNNQASLLRDLSSRVLR